MADIEKLVEQLSSLTVLEAADLAKALEEAWGVSAAAAVAVAAAPAAGGAAAAVAVPTAGAATAGRVAIGDHRRASRAAPSPCACRAPGRRTTRRSRAR